jgi:hypothetical protein
MKLPEAWECGRASPGRSSISHRTPSRPISGTEKETLDGKMAFRTFRCRAGNPVITHLLKELIYA